MQRRFKRPWDWLIVQSNSNGDLLQMASNQVFDIALIASKMPDSQDHESISQFMLRRPEIPCIGLVDEVPKTAPDSWPHPPVALFPRPLPPDLPARLRTVIELQRGTPLRQFQHDEDSVFLHGSHPEIVQARERAIEYGPGWEPIQVMGETGTGREHLARNIHTNGRRGRAFVYLYCRGWNDDELRRLIFGSPQHSGLLALAAGGTLYLDRAEFIPPAIQKDFSQVMDSEHPVRLIASTAPGIELAEQLGGGWRSIQLPPIRERTADFKELISRILVDLQWELGHFNLRRVSPEALEQIQRFPFSTDNLTELRRMLVWHSLSRPDQAVLEASDLPDWMQAWVEHQS